MLAAEKRRLRNRRTSSIGAGVRSSHADEQRRGATAASPKATEDRRVGPAGGRRLDDRPHERGEAGDGEGERRAGRACAAPGSRDSRHEPAAGDQRGDDEREVDHEHRVPRRRARAASRPTAGRSRCPAPPRAAQMPIARARSLGRERGGEDRQGGRHDEGAADAHQRAGRRSAISADPAIADQAEPAPKIGRPMFSARLRPKRSPSAAGGEQQPGEHEHVGVDDPLQLATRRPRDRARAWAGRR